MKTSQKLTKPLIISGLVVSTLALVAWSPPSGEDSIWLTSGKPAIVLNSNNTANPDKISGTTSGINPFRGIIVGQGNDCGTGSGAQYAAVIGNSNLGNASSSVIVGASNTFAVGATSLSESFGRSGLFGDSNTVAKNSGSSVVVGTGNTAYANDSFVMGSLNTVNGETIATATRYSAAIGYFNGIAADTGWAIGYQNGVFGSRGVAIGTGTRVSSASTSTIALGLYNADTVADDVLVVGNGTSVNNRQTALRITADGSVILGRAQGDISMGNYQ